MKLLRLELVALMIFILMGTACLVIMATADHGPSNDQIVQTYNNGFLDGEGNCPQ